ncbi:LysR substrate-binding domain-containing protein [Methylobacterium sp. EM32]|uniref:LysR substrate-binding domain-containing protein n=1 Tax=Methylobacterium sp. EM32 TaxID=3163481 RepID=UPI0033B1D775
MGVNKATGAFELRHLRYFVTLAEERNFSRAAERLGIAQPGLSQQILNLEALVGTSLLDRSRRSVQLTLPGQVFLQEARKTLLQADTALAAVRRAGRGETGRISIGYVASAAYAGVLTASLAGFRTTHPEVELQLTEMEMGLQLAAIAGGALDFGYVRPPVKVPDGVATTCVLREPLVVAVGAAHALADHETIPLAALSGETFIAPRQAVDVGFHHNAVTACRESGFEPTISATGRDFTTIASMVAVGLGVALVPRSLTCLQLPGLVYRPVTGSTTTSDLAVAYRRNEPAPAVRAFIRHHHRADPAERDAAT